MLDQGRSPGIGPVARATVHSPWLPSLAMKIQRPVHVRQATLGFGDAGRCENVLDELVAGVGPIALPQFFRRWGRRWP